MQHARQHLGDLDGRGGVILQSTPAARGTGEEFRGGSRD
jgi:hypothetical protein